LLRFSRAIDALHTRIGRLVAWGVLAAILISPAEDAIRNALDTSSNSWLELQWILFGAVLLLCSGRTLLSNEHIRIDIVNGALPKRIDRRERWGHGAAVSSTKRAP
jgi:TRAP-type mannitol/chloroaromatic compound transport system permease small subunit